MVEERKDIKKEIIRDYSEFLKPIVGEEEFHDRLISGLQIILRDVAAEEHFNSPDAFDEIISRTSLVNFATSRGYKTHSINGLVYGLKSKNLTCYDRLMTFHEKTINNGGILGLMRVGPTSFNLLNDYLESKGFERLA